MPRQTTVPKLSSGEKTVNPANNMMKDSYLLDPKITFLNHGSFGACPKPVFEEYQNWQRKLEEQPVKFMTEDVYHQLKIARDILGTFVGCDGDDLIFVPNSTTAVNTVIRSLNLSAGDQILSTDHEYGSLVRAWEWLTRNEQVEFIQREFPLPMTNHDEFVEHFWEGVTDKTRVIFLSQITSSTGLIFPVAGICKKAREAGILTIIDGAHVPGHIPLNIREMDPDIYTGACHKWLSAPKGTTFLYVRKDFQESIKPLIISWGAIIDPSPSPFIHENQYQGTRDPSPFLAVPAAIRFQGENDWELVKLRCCRLTRETRDRVYDIIHTAPICPNSEEWLGQMASVEIEVDDPEKLKNSLLEDYAIEIPVIAWKEKSLLRFSFNVYNEQRDADKLINALMELF